MGSSCVGRVGECDHVGRGELLCGQGGVVVCLWGAPVWAGRGGGELLCGQCLACGRSRGRGLVGGWSWASILFECCVCERWSGWTSPRRVSVDVSPRESGGVLLHSWSVPFDLRAVRLSVDLQAVGSSVPAIKRGATA